MRCKTRIAGSILAAGIGFTSGLFAQQEVRTHEGGAPDDRFGHAVHEVDDLDGDGVGDYVVGAPGLLDEVDTGVVQAFSGASGDLIWSLYARDTQGFGWSLGSMGDLDGDGVDEVIVGNPHWDGLYRGIRVINAGRVTVHSGVDGVEILRIETDCCEDKLGYSVAGIGDVNGDGIPDLVAGAPSLTLTNPWGSWKGAVLVYSGLDGSLIHLLHLAGGADMRNYFGTSVASAGDVNGDGVADIVAGGPSLALAYFSGNVALFSGLDGSVLSTFQGDNAGDQFGFSVDGGRDVNQDGFPDILIGAPQGGASDQPGYARLISGSNGSVLTTVTGDAAGDGFGRSVRLVEANRGPRPDLLIGAPQEGTGPGYARLISGSGYSTLYDFRGDAPAACFGSSVSGLDDLDGDGIGDVAIGAPEAAGRGRLHVRAANDLYLNAWPKTVAVGESITLTIGQWPAGSPTLLMLVELDGVPFHRTLDVGTIAPDRYRTLRGAVPPGLAGLSMTLRAYSLDIKGRVVDTAPEEIVVQ